MTHQWYVRQEGLVTGPYSSGQLQEMARSGKITGTDLISRDQEKWTSALKVKGLEVQAKSLENQEESPPRPVASFSSADKKATTDDDHGPASISMRCAALTIDVLVYGMSLFTLFCLPWSIVLLIVEYSVDAQVHRDMSQLLENVGAALALWFFVLIFIRGRTRQSIGQLATNIRVVPNESGGVPLPYPWGRSAVVQCEPIEPCQDRALFWLRVSAWLIDVACLAFVNLVVAGLGAAAYIFYVKEAFESESIAPFAFFIGYILLVVDICYVLGRDTAKGHSIGKRLCRLSIVDPQGEPFEIKPEGRKNPLSRRNELMVIPFLPILEAMVAFLRPDQRRLGDLRAGTQVIRAQNPVVAGNPETSESST